MTEYSLHNEAYTNRDIFIKAIEDAQEAIGDTSELRGIFKEEETPLENLWVNDFLTSAKKLDDNINENNGQVVLFNENIPKNTKAGPFDNSTETLTRNDISVINRMWLLTQEKAKMHNPQYQGLMPELKTLKKSLDMVMNQLNHQQIVNKNVILHRFRRAKSRNQPLHASIAQGADISGSQFSLYDLKLQTERAQQMARAQLPKQDTPKETVDIEPESTKTILTRQITETFGIKDQESIQQILRKIIAESINIIGNEIYTLLRSDTPGEQPLIKSLNESNLVDKQKVAVINFISLLDTQFVEGTMPEETGFEQFLYKLMHTKKGIEVFFPVYCKHTEKVPNVKEFADDLTGYVLSNANQSEFQNLAMLNSQTVKEFFDKTMAVFMQTK